MNDQPHTHEPRLTQEYPFLNCGDWMVQYGTTRVRLARENDNPANWSEDKRHRKISAAIRQAVRSHDEGSIGAGKLQETLKDAAEALKQPDPSRPSWGSALLERLRNRG